MKSNAHRALGPGRLISAPGISAAISGVTCSRGRKCNISRCLCVARTWRVSGRLWVARRGRVCGRGRVIGGWRGRPGGHALRIIRVVLLLQICPGVLGIGDAGADDDDRTPGPPQSRPRPPPSHPRALLRDRRREACCRAPRNSPGSATRQSARRLPSACGMIVIDCAMPRCSPRAGRR